MLENCTLALQTVKKMPFEQAKEIAIKHLTDVGLQDFIYTDSNVLSGGQKQRVAIGSALASNREVIIFDEPTSGLDLNHMKQVSKLLKDLKQMGKTILIISHDLELLLRTCDYVLHIAGGQVKDEYDLSGHEQRLVSFFAD